VALLKALRPNMANASEDTKMYYDLLTIKAEDKTYITHRSDKLIMPLVNYYEHGGDKALLPVAYYYAGRTYADMQDAPRALDYFQRALEAMKDRKDVSLKGKIYSQMGYLYMNQYLYDNAIKTFGMAYKYSSEVNDTSSIIYCLSDIASAFTEKGQNHLSLKMLLKAHKLAKKKGDISLINFVEYYMSIRYSSIGEYELAKKYITPALKNIEPQDSSAIYGSIADIYRLLGKEDSAFYYFNKVKDSGSLYAKKAAYRFFTRTEIERNGNKKMLNDFDTYCNYIDTVRTVTSTEALAKANALYNYQLREVENIRLEKANARMHAIVVIACMVALALLLLSLALLQYYRHRRIRMQMQMERLKQIKENIYKKSQEYIDSNKRRIAELEHLLETTGQENEELKTKLQNERSRLISENEIAEIENRESKLAYERIVKTDAFRRFNSLSSSEHAKNPTAEDWAELERVVNEEYPGFTNRLMGFCNISSNELRVSLLLKINVSPSRIAILTNHTETSVSATRRRLYEKAFNKKGTPKEWDNVIKRL
jgi:tetratricopeptide (TPR) repeat protein